MEKLHGEFLLILIRILNEHWTDNSDIDRRAECRTVLIHQLAVEFMPWSKISKMLMGKRVQWDAKEIRVAEQMLPELADTRDVKGVKHYGLKKRLLSEWNRYFINYDNAEQSRAYETVSIMAKQTGEDAKASLSLAKVYHTFNARFAPILNILECQLMENVIMKSLKHRPSQRMG